MRPNSSHTGKRRKNRSRGASEAPGLSQDQREALESALGHRFKQADLLDRALTHRSAAQTKMRQWSNERLEFLGDRVLGLVIAESLLERFETAREGELAPRLNGLVNRDACAAVGSALGLENYILVDKAERAAGGPAKPSLIADAVEALIAAIYLDGGLAAARKFVLKQWKPQINAMAAAPRDPKSALQEWAQGRGLPAPVYRHEGRLGPDHAPVFIAAVTVVGYEPSPGSGASKQAAERAAAQTLLDLILGATT